MFGSKIVDNFEFVINWQKPYIINRECWKCVHPDLTNLENFLHWAMYRCECRWSPEAAAL